MTLSPAAVATARRNVAKRIERFLAELERDGRQPDGREAFRVLLALVRLRIGLFPEAEEALLGKEEDTAEAENQSAGAAMTVDQLRGELDRIMKAAAR